VSYTETLPCGKDFRKAGKFGPAPLETEASGNRAEDRNPQQDDPAPPTLLSRVPGARVLLENGTEKPKASAGDRIGLFGDGRDRQIPSQCTE
jgi:hypothetical protein